MANLIWVLISKGTIDEVIKSSMISQNSGEDTVVTVFSTEEDFCSELTSFYSDSGANLSILIDARYSDAVAHILNILKKPLVLFIPKIVLLSTLLTWSGKRYMQPIEDCSAEFIERIPLLDTMEIYATENTFFDFSRTCPISKGKLYILSVGLVYGQGGYDLADTFRSIFDNEASLSILSVDNSVKVPIIHIDQLLKLIESLIQYQSVMPSVVIPVVDNTYSSASSIGGALMNISRTLNGAPIEVKAKEIPKDFGITEEDPRLTLWNSDLWFSKASEEGLHGSLVSDLENTWQEYVDVNSLNPIKVLVAGPPEGGMADLSKVVSERLALKHIDPVAAVKFCFQVDSTSLSDPNVSVEVVSSLKGQIIEALEARAAAAIKDKGKGKGEPEAAPMEINEEALTDDFVRSEAMSPELMRTCLLCTVLCDPLCLRKGYAVDMWDVKGVFSSRGDFIATLKTLLPTTSTSNEELVSSIVGLCVEIHVNIQTILEKMSVTFPPKPSKEQTAALKTLEGVLDDYTAAMIETGEPDGKGFPTSHKVFCELFADSNILRLKGDKIPPESLAKKIIDELTKGIRSPPTTPVIASSRNALEASSEEKTSDSNDTCSSIEPALSGKDQEDLLKRSKKFQNFLMSTVVPHLTSGLIRIARERPEDPIAFMSAYLQQQSATILLQSRNEAFQKFEQLLK